MDPTHGRDEHQEEILNDMIRGRGDDIDVTMQFLNDSGEGDESLIPGGSRSREIEAYASGEGGLDSFDEGEADGSGKVNIL